MKRVHPTEAPWGYKAVRKDRSSGIGYCNGCAFAGVGCHNPLGYTCGADVRKDGVDVIFIRKETKK